MRLNILIGGKAGQGINKTSEIISQVLIKYGYFVFNYRDYPSLIRGGHNFNILSISDEKIGSYESTLNFIIPFDEETVKLHKNNLAKDGLVLDYKKFEDLGRDSNIALAAALLKILGVPKEELKNEVKQFKTESAIQAAEKGYNSQENKFSLKLLKNKLVILSGSEAVAQGAINSKIDLFIAYPMTPATGVMHELANCKGNPTVFQPESEISAVNSALGASFTGKKVMVGTSGGGYDLMSEGLSFQGQSEIPLTLYLASRPGPATGVPTYSAQSDLDIALRAGHGEFPRVVIAPGSVKECIEKTNEAIYLAEKFNTLSIILSDKHLAESQFSFSTKLDTPLTIQQNRQIPGKTIVKATSYEHDESGNTTESPELTIKGVERRLKNYDEIKKQCSKFQMIKTYGKKQSKNLIIGWGSTKSVILDAITDLDVQFLQVLYLKPLSDEIKQIMENAENLILIEDNVTGQLGRLLREKTGIKIENKILKYDGRPFTSNKLNQEIKKLLI